MRLVFTPNGGEAYVFWQTSDRAMLKRINRLIDDIVRDPFDGIGKPEQLRHALAGAWSRRIDDEHRLVYLVDGDDVVVVDSIYASHEAFLKAAEGRRSLNVYLTAPTAVRLARRLKRDRVERGLSLPPSTA